LWSICPKKPKIESPPRILRGLVCGVQHLADERADAQDHRKILVRFRVDDGDSPFKR
jgi:hypothetical protein